MNTKKTLTMAGITAGALILLGAVVFFASPEQRFRAECERRLRAGDVRGKIHVWTTSQPGQFGLNLDQTDLRDLYLLQDLPISELVLSEGVSDLSALTRIPIRSLSIRRTDGVDLAPLVGKQLGSLVLVDVHNVNLDQVAGFPLEELVIWNTGITDLSPLAGMSLRRIIFDATHVTNGISSLREMESIEWIGTEPFQYEARDVFWREFDGESREPQG